MKKTFIAAAIVIACAGSAMAEGYQVNTLSTRQIGMGHTGTALHLGSESQIFNPAGLGWLDKNVELKASVTPIFSTVKATQGENVYETESKASTPMSINVGFSIYENFKAGVSFYTPYGSSIDWTNNWPGACLNQSVDLKMFTVQPTLAYRPIPNLSIGVGAMITWGNVNLNKGLISPSSYAVLQQINGLTPEGYVTPASVNLDGTAETTVGINAGIMWDINDQWTVGFSYRSKMNMKVKNGTASLRFANETAKQLLENQLGLIDQSRFVASMPAVAVWNLGVAYKPIPRLTLAADFQLSQWKAYDCLDITFPDLPAEAQAVFNQHIIKNYKNSMTYHLGAEFAMTDRLDLRAGIMIDTTPVDDNNYNPETPGTTRIEPSCGFSFRPIDRLSIDVAFMYVAGLNANDRSCSYDDFVAKTVYQTLQGQGLPAEAAQAALGQMGLSLRPEFRADYSIHALCPSIGITLDF